jgi:hypothetical protein
MMPIIRMVMIRSASGDQQTARDFQNKNPAAIISLQMAANGTTGIFTILGKIQTYIETVDYTGLAAYNWDGTSTTDIEIPMVIISKPSAEKLFGYIAKYGNVTVLITSNGTFFKKSLANTCKHQLNDYYHI